MKAKKITRQALKKFYECNTLPAIGGELRIYYDEETLTKGEFFVVSDYIPLVGGKIYLPVVFRSTDYFACLAFAINWLYEEDCRENAEKPVKKLAWVSRR